MQRVAGEQCNEHGDRGRQWHFCRWSDLRRWIRNEWIGPWVPPAFITGRFSVYQEAKYRMAWWARKSEKRGLCCFSEACESLSQQRSMWCTIEKVALIQGRCVIHALANIIHAPSPSSNLSFSRIYLCAKIAVSRYRRQVLVVFCLFQHRWLNQVGEVTACSLLKTVFNQVLASLSAHECDRISSLHGHDATPIRKSGIKYQEMRVPLTKLNK